MPLRAIRAPRLAVLALGVLSLLAACTVPATVSTPPAATSKPSPLAALSPTLVPVAPTPGATITPTTVPVITATARATAQPTGVTLRLADLPLAELSPEAATFLASREGKLGVAVVVPERQAIYLENGDQLMSMASVVKVVIMLAVLDRAQTQGRLPTEREMLLLRPMIERSDNAATTALWQDLGGAPAVDAFLSANGFVDIVPNETDQWGASRASARAVAVLFANLAFGDLLQPPLRVIALDLLSHVTPEQRWGVSAGAPAELPEGAIIGLKDGWYPAGFGWWVNSAGVLIPGDDRPAYAIAVLTRGQPSWEYGIESIEGVALPVHQRLHTNPR